MSSKRLYLCEIITFDKAPPNIKITFDVTRLENQLGRCRNFLVGGSTSVSISATSTSEW